MNKVQFMVDENGKRTSVLLSIEAYEELLAAADRDEDYVSIPYTAGENDDETIPHDVISIMVDKNVSLQAAWRMFRRLSQQDVADSLGIKQSAVSQLEKSVTPRKETLEKLAELYNCRLGQLILD